MEKLPQLSLELVQQLDDMFPERCPDVTMSERDIWLYAGKRSLVRYLLSLVNDSTPFGD